MAEVAMVLDGGDIIGVDDLQGYHEIIARAFAVHVDREKVRHGLWKRYSGKDQVKQIKIKADRAEHTLELVPALPFTPGQIWTDDAQALVDATVEELYDIINYAVFAVRKLNGSA